MIVRSKSTTSAINNKRVHIDLVKREDIPEICKLMKETNYFLPAGLGSPGVCSAVCKDALKRNDVIIAVAKLDKSVVGYSIKVIHRSRYWKSFVFRYPFLGVKIFSGFLLRRFKKITKNKHESFKHSVEDLVEIVSTNRTWKDSSESIAKAEHTAVSNNARGRSIGLKLHLYTFKILRERGITRVDNTISFDNISSIRMNRKAGWSFSLTCDYLFGTIDLTNKSEIDID